MRATSQLLAALALTVAASNVRAEEPNETFFDATILAPGVLSVSDELSSGSAPDTIVGGFGGLFGDLVAFNDNDFSVGDGFGSAIFDVPLNSGAVDFSVSGFGDSGFFGNHNETGGFEATVTVFDFFGDEVDQFTLDGFLEPGVVEEYRIDSLPPLSQSYDVIVDNTANLVADVDFFTFTGLDPGADFAVETEDPFGFAIDTFIGWFDEFGSILDTDDDDGADRLSRLEGVVPGNGEVTIAVSGFGDNAFQGQHNEDGLYDLVLSVESAGLAGDFNGDLVVDAADYTVWRDGLAGGSFTQADYTTWENAYGSTPPLSEAVPEPASALIVAILAALAGVRRA